MKSNLNLDIAVKSELIEVLYKNLSIGLFSIFLMASIIVWQLRHSDQIFYITIWYVVLAINLILGNILNFWYQKTKNNLKLQRYHYYLYIAGATLTACLLGIMASIFMPADINQQTLIIIMIVCITSASIQSMHASYLASILYLICSILPLLIWEMIQYIDGTKIYSGILVATIAYSIYLIAEIHRGHVTITNNIRLKLQNIISNNELKIQKDKVEYLSKHDILTNLYNRRYLEDILSEYNMKLIKENINVSVLMFDIDYFKEVNDIFGHEAGDVVLKKFGMLTKTFFGETPLTFRYGGEEFLIILVGMSAAKAYQRAQAFRAYIKKSQKSLGKLHKPITISGGIATFPDDGKDLYYIIHEADKALYKAKENGRDKIELSQNYLMHLEQ